MEKKNIYIILAFILAVFLSFSIGYYFGIKIGVYVTENNYEKILKLNELNDFEDKIENLEKNILEKTGTGKTKDSGEGKNSVQENRTVKTNILSGELIESREENFTFKETKKDTFGNDFDTDNSLQKFVNSEIPFENKKYIPKNLEKISSEFILDTKGGNQTLRSEANEALQKMGEKFFEENNEKIKVVSAYRSYEYQVGIKKGGCPDSLCAKAGFSEHQTGLVVDLWSASNEKTWKNDKNLQKYFSWLNENAHNFGFHNTYQKGIKVDGYEVEPWHWRYLGVELATYLKEKNLTIAEYYNSL